MSEIRKVAAKTFNADKLREEIAASGLPHIPGKFSWYGFVQTPGDNRRYEPGTGPVYIGRQDGTDFFAEPGELGVGFTRDLTAPEDAALDALLAAHDHTQPSAAQQEQDQDAADVAEYKAAKQAFLDDRAAILATLAPANWDGLNNAQTKAATKDCLQRLLSMVVAVGKVTNVLVKRED